MAKPTITTDEWLAELDRLKGLANVTAGFTKNELAKRHGRSKAWANDRITAGIAAGVIQRIGVRRVEGSFGLRNIPVYDEVKKRSTKHD